MREALRGLDAGESTIVILCTLNWVSFKRLDADAARFVDEARLICKDILRNGPSASNA